MTDVEIKYCVPCGLLPAAEEVSHALLTRFGRDLAGLHLIPSHGGVFKVRAGDTLVFDKATDGYDVGEIVRRVAEQVAPEPVPLQRGRVGGAH
jgi:selenoprotein W-related protein